MRSIMVLAALAAASSGCGSPEDRRVALAEPPPMPAVAAAAPGDTAAAPAAADQPGTDDVLDAGMLMATARDVCRLPAPALARFAEYSAWVVKGDPQRKALFVVAAQEVAKEHAAVIAEGRQEAYRREACERVRRVLATIEQGMGTPRHAEAMR